MTKTLTARGAAIACGAALLVVALPACAEAYGPPSPSLAAILGAIVALPSALACVVAEAVLPRRRPPVWLLVSCVAIVLAGIGGAVADRRGMAGQLAPILPLLAFLVPPATVLALRAAVPAAWPRLALGWLLVLMIGAVVAGRAEAVTTAGLSGAVGVCVVTWSVVVLILAVARISPPAGPQPISVAGAVGSAGRRLVDILDRAEQGVARHLDASHPLVPGLVWWLASSAVVYLAVGIAIACHLFDEGQWFGIEVAQAVDWFGWRPPTRTLTSQLWWWLGSVWSLAVGAAGWGIAATVGWVDAGRLRPLRLAAILLGFVLVAWSVHLALVGWEIRTAEERASGLRR